MIGVLEGSISLDAAMKLGRNHLAGIFLCACLSGAHGVEVRFVVVDEAGRPMPARIHLKDESGKAVRPKGLPFWHDHFVCDGTAQLELAPGNFSYEVERGPEYSPTSGTLKLAEKGAHSVTNQLRRLVNLSKEGWWSGELHVHRPVTDIELLMQAEDLHVAPVITWWNNRNAWTNRALPMNPLVRFDGDRFYHLMGGEDERNGGALFYFNLSRPLDIAGAAPEYPSPMKFLAEAHREPGVWVDIEKPFWYDTPIWLASGMVDSIGIAHNHMHRGGVYPGEAWGRARDKQRFPDPQGNGFYSQEIYYHILNAGLRLPPSAGSASGVLPNPVGYNRVYVHVDGELTYEKWWDGLRAGRVFVSNGPLLRCRANGQLPGHVFQARAGQALEINLEVELDGRDPVPALEIIQNGRVVRTVPYADWRKAGALGKIEVKETGWFLVRAIADVPTTFRFASTGPFYVEIGQGKPRISKASAQFFLDWVRERMQRVKLENPRQQEEVIQQHQAAERFWQDKVASANAE